MRECVCVYVCECVCLSHFTSSVCVCGCVYVCASGPLSPAFSPLCLPLTLILSVSLYLQVNIDDLLALLMDYFAEECKYDPENQFLESPIVSKVKSNGNGTESTNRSRSNSRPATRDQPFQALAALNESMKAKPTQESILAGERKVRIVPRNQALI